MIELWDAEPTTPRLQRRHPPGVHISELLAIIRGHGWKNTRIAHALSSLVKNPNCQATADITGTTGNMQSNCQTSLMRTWAMLANAALSGGKKTVNNPDFTEKLSAPNTSAPRSGSAQLWACPVCSHVMTEEQSKGYRGCPTGMHFAQHIMVEEQPCPDCYGGHFRPCQLCGDTGRVIFAPNAALSGAKENL